MDLETRTVRHAALGDERRLLIADRLSLSDTTFAELQAELGLPGNLLAHHLNVLETAGLIHRNTSEGDRRRRYISLRWENLPMRPRVETSISRVAFVCSHNSARSQFAAALWQKETGLAAWSAGTNPASEVHPTAVRIAGEFDVDLSHRVPAGYDSLPSVDLIVSVCDRANEAGVPDVERRFHWSVPDPAATGGVDAFRSSFSDIARRIHHLAAEPQT